MRLAGVFLAVVWMLTSSFPVEARTWRVEVDGSGDAPFIQAAIDSSTDGDLVLVGPGVYFEHLRFKGKDIWLKSFAGAEVTVIDGNWEPGSVVQFVNGETNDAILDGFTITHGTGVPISEGADGNIGGGLYAEDSWPTVRNSLFIDNVPTGPKTFGGAILFRTDEHPSSAPEQPMRIENNTFIANEATNGGGIALTADAEIINNVFIRNTTNTGDGSAIWCSVTWHGPVLISGNQFWENEADDHGGAVEVFGSHGNQAIVENNLFVRNVAYGSDGPANRGAGGAIGWRASDGVIRNNTFYDNKAFGSGPTCRAGAILFGGIRRTILVENNIFATSTGCALTVLVDHDITLTDNLFWNNGNRHVQDIEDSLPENWEDFNVLADPLFCGPDADNFTVSIESPALTHANGPIGAFTGPGCGPGVPVERTSWGTLKMKFE